MYRVYPSRIGFPGFSRTVFGPWWRCVSLYGARYVASRLAANKILHTSKYENLSVMGMLVVLCVWVTPVSAGELALVDEDQLIQSPDWVASGMQSMEKKDYAVAIRIYTQALKANPFNADAANNLAVAFAAVQEYEAALKLFEQAVRLAPKRRDIASNLNSMREWSQKNPDYKQFKTPLQKGWIKVSVPPPQPW